MQLASGDLKSPFHWADQILLSEDFDLHEAIYRLTLARIRLAQGRYAEVEKLLAGRVPPPMTGSQISRQLESNLLLAASIAGQKRLPEAFGLIETSLALAQPEGYVRAFLNGGQPIQMLLAQWLAYAGAGPLRDYAIHLLSQFKAELKETTTAQAKDSPAGDLIEPLSQRELEVLHLIALGSTNHQIARQLIVSTGTVKAHTASIYRKLDVANRTEAVARARQLGILP